ncbi:MAG: undecaprenyldiphospho-muramoylpentapeptide beta-N-acetylglucosaminyltransferase [Chthoniobacterales bacterium]
MKTVIACGGTGGHLFPGLSVAQELHSRGHEILLIVSEKAIDSVALKNFPEFKAERLPSIGMPSFLSPAFVQFLRRLWESTTICKHLYKKHQPRAVLGMGGFTSTPPILAARRRRIPAFIHESNAIPGKANKFSARFCTRILLGFDAGRSYFPGRGCVVTGTPVLQNMGTPIPRDIALKKFDLDPNKKTILVMGGSQGASGLNQIMFRIATRLRGQNIQIIHLSGEKDEQLAAANYLREEIPSYVSAFCHEMATAYSAADLVVSRAGASSLNELSFFGLPSILLPYPFAADNHQEANANIFVQAGASEMVRESDANVENFSNMLLNILTDENRHSKMGKAAADLLPRDAAKRVADVIEREVRRA